MTVKPELEANSVRVLDKKNKDLDDHGHQSYNFLCLHSFVQEKYTTLLQFVI